MKKKSVMAEALKQKIQSIENTVPKSHVRQNFTGFSHQHLNYMFEQGKPINHINCLTLPAADWHFEKGLINATENAFYLKNKPSLQFDGVDWGFQTSVEALENMPENATITGSCSFDDFLKYENVTLKNGYSRTDCSIPRREALKYYLVWADFCNDASVPMLKNFVNVIRNNMTCGFAAITVKLSARKKGSCKKEYIERFKDYCSSKERERAVEVTINKMLHLYNKNGNQARCVGSIKYPGGEAGRSRMLTLIYAVNIPDGVIIPIREDRTIKSPMFKTRKTFAAKLKKAGRWNIKIGKKGRKGGKVKKVMTKEEKKAAMYAAKYQSVWKMLSAEKKCKLATKCGKNVHQLGSMIAHFHGKLATKRVHAIA